ncbi:hypothetical protein B0H13DRAFT_1902765 [Mycena leptocephala]|nr:hypothetical protein B0H13DRAFT_1902765 [Mycena leptocephala]
MWTWTTTRARKPYEAGASDSALTRQRVRTKPKPKASGARDECMGIARAGNECGTGASMRGNARAEVGRIRKEETRAKQTARWPENTIGSMSGMGRKKSTRASRKGKGRRAGGRVRSGRQKRSEDSLGSANTHSVRVHGSAAIHFSSSSYYHHLHRRHRHCASYSRRRTMATTHSCADQEVNDVQQCGNPIYGGEYVRQHFVACKGWKPKRCPNFLIPSNVDEHLLANALNGEAIANDPNKLKYCPHAHIVDGKSDGRTTKKLSPPDATV